jgi:hypothetical protein
MASVIRVESRPTFRDMIGRFATAEKNLLENRGRIIIRPEGRRFVQLLREEAPEKTGEFKKGFRFRTFVKGGAVGFTATVPQPLGRFIVKGTKAHSITPKGPGYPLRFYWPKMGRVVYFYHVNHPGTKANPFVGRAYDRWKPGAKVPLARISSQYIADVKAG